METHVDLTSSLIRFHENVNYFCESTTFWPYSAIVSRECMWHIEAIPGL